MNRMSSSRLVRGLRQVLMPWTMMRAYPSVLLILCNGMEGCVHKDAVGLSSAETPNVDRLSEIRIVPDSVKLGAGGQQQFVAFGLLNTGDSVDVEVDWAATGGTIDADGMFTAGDRGGDYEITAMSADVAGLDAYAGVSIVYEPPDIFDHNFSNGSSGGLTDGNGDPFIENTGWTLVQNSSDDDDDWKAYVERSFNGPVDDGGEAFFLRPAVGGRKSIYVAIKAEFTGIVARGDNSKWLRFQSFSVSGGFIGGLGYNGNGGQWQFDFNNLGSGWEYTLGRRGGQSLAPADLEGSRFTFEVHADYGLPGNAARITVWVNGVQTQVSRSYVAPGTFGDIYMDAAILAAAGQSWSNGGPSSPGTRFDQLQFDGTTDLSSGTGAMRIARIAVSTTRIGW